MKIKKFYQLLSKEFEKINPVSLKCKIVRESETKTVYSYRIHPNGLTSFEFTRNSEKSWQIGRDPNKIIVEAGIAIDKFLDDYKYPRHEPSND